MSDSGSNSNVEDVLSSVRRLVSNELPRMPRGQVPRKPAALVLTDAQRIGENGDEHREGPALSLEERIAELEAAVSARSDEWEPDGSEDLDQHRPDRVVFIPRNHSRPGAPLRLSRISLLETAPANPDPAPASGDATPTFRHDDGTAPKAPAPVGDEPTADPAEENVRRVLASERAKTDAAEVADTGNAEETAPARPEPAGPVGAAEGEGGKRALSRALAEALVADPGFEDALADAVTASIAETPQPDEPEEPASGAPEVAAADGAPNEVPPTHDPAPASAAEPLKAIDADTLREVVGGLIREELQGDLGERITRNVRKLVRREINRALDARLYE